MAAETTRVKDIPTTATTAAADDYVLLDGATNGTRKGLASNLITPAAAITAADITDAGTSGRAVLQAETQAQALDALGAGVLTVNAQPGSYVLADADINGRTEIRQTSASGVILTINADISAKLETPVYGKQVGAGAVTFVAGAGVTLHIQGGKTKTAEQYAPWAALQVSANVWEICGGLS